MKPDPILKDMQKEFISLSERSSFDDDVLNFIKRITLKEFISLFHDNSKSIFEMHYQMLHATVTEDIIRVYGDIPIERVIFKSYGLDIYLVNKEN